MKTHRQLYFTVVTALMAAAVAAVAPFSIHIGAIPLSLCSLGVYLCAVLLGGVRGTAAVGIYLALGAIGVPVFAGFVGGVQAFAGPTGGYLIGYLPCAAVIGWGVSRFGDRRPAIWVLFLVLGTAVLYLCGTAWFVISTKTPIGAAVASCVLPFLPGDAVKIAVATAAYPLKKILKHKQYL